MCTSMLIHPQALKALKFIYIRDLSSVEGGWKLKRMGC